MRRWPAVLLGVTLAVLPAASALAVTPAIKMDVLARTTVIAGGEAYVLPAFTAGPGYSKHTVTGVKLTFETSGAGLNGTSLKGNDLHSEWGCVAHGTHKVVCTVPVPLPVSDKPWSSSLGVVLKAGTATVGGTGDLKVTFDAKGVPEVVKHSKVGIAEGVIMSTGEVPSGVPKEAAPGAAFDMTVGLDRSSPPGNGPVIHGAALAFKMDYAFAPAGQFSNCYYRDGQLTACLFDRDLPDGAVYATTLPLRIRPDTNPGPGEWFAGNRWMTPGDLDDLVANRTALGQPGLGVRGAGGVLELRALTGEQPGPARPGPRQSVGQFDDSGPFPGASLVVTGEPRRTDFAAVGTTVSGAPGTTVRVPVGVHNNGPVTIDRTHDRKPAAAARFTLPPGTAAVTVPSGCTPYGAQYVCESPPLLPAGQTYTWTFALKVTKLVPDAKGLIESNPASCPCVGYPDDPNKANDTAPVILNAGATVPPTTPATGVPGDGMPITGPRTGGIAAGAAALILAGLVAYVASRRRRTRFEP
jgi:hypothetical protein